MLSDDEEDAWALQVTASAKRSLAEPLPESVTAAVVEFITGALLAEPRRVGHELRDELAGQWSARRGTYRVLYRLDDEARTVQVTVIEHRATVYRRR